MLYFKVSMLAFARLFRSKAQGGGNASNIQKQVIYSVSNIPVRSTQ